MKIRRHLADRLPAQISLRLWGERSVRRVFGLHPPGDLITSLVPFGRNAVDVGANRGVYTCWMAKRAAVVDAFEPQPDLARYIRSARLNNVRVHEIALSDQAGTARLLVPSDDALARLASSDAADVPDAVQAQPELGTTKELPVKTLTLDSFGLLDVGFLKIDVEGHELAVLRGADETIATNRPIVFIESEARHARGAPASVIELMRDRHGYRRAAFVRRWKIVDLEEFDLQRDQLRFLPNWANPDYVSNFVFWPS